MPKIGYARVSSSSQDLDIQKAKLKVAGCEVIRAETVSGASRDDRSELATVMEFLREGDELVVHRLDRLGRSTRDVLNLVHELDAKSASLRVLEPEVTTAGDMGRMVRISPVRTTRSERPLHNVFSLRSSQPPFEHARGGWAM
ncbi:recombinase family protein [Aliiroseovarius sp.]|uniref:recombinase family protein n=1 Tax=Aliiroseovarius sp. TaxID=1872442 RepID=UPI003BAC9886